MTIATQKDKRDYYSEQDKPKQLETMKSNKKLAQKMYKEIWNIYNTYGGYKYNDSLWCQAQGSSDAFDETMEDGNWEALIKEYESVLKYMRHIREILILQDNIPPQVYC